MATRHSTHQSSRNGSTVHSTPFTGSGAAYIRVSGDQQDTDRQFSSIRQFEERNDVTIPKAHWFDDQNWARDKADKRPKFQQMIKSAECGLIQWIVVDRLDRFGTRDAHQLAYYIYRLRECECRLYDVSGKEWTEEDISTIITLVIEGDKSRSEQREKAHRTLSGKIEKAKQGEWQGGPTRLGFDVVCYDRSSNRELWRVMFDGFQRRIKVWPDGTKQRFDGKGNFPATQPTEVLRIAPSKDKSKIKAAVNVFKRYATESISFTALAQQLNELGFTNWSGGAFQSGQVSQMLADPAYLGYYSYNKKPHGKFKRYREGGIEEENNPDERSTQNNPTDFVLSERQLFKPLVDQKLWDTVQEKLNSRPIKSRAPRSAKAYLAGMLYCGSCGRRMYARAASKEHYFCGTYFDHIKYGKTSKSPCQRNLVYQDELEGFIENWVDASGRKLDLVGDAIGSDDFMAKLGDQSNEQWQGFCDSMDRVWDYLKKHCPEAIGHLDESADVVIESLIQTYRNNFSPEEITREIEALDIEHSALVERALNLNAKRAVEKVNAKISALETRMEQLELQRKNAADLAEAHYREWRDMRTSIRQLQTGFKKEGELRRKAETLRSVIHRIECHFEPTGKTGRGCRRTTRLTKVVICPISGQATEISERNGNNLLQSPATTVK